MIPLRIVLDTSIIVSAALVPERLSRTVLVVSMTKPAHLYVCDAILNEYCDVLAHPEIGISQGLRQEFLRQIRNRARMVRAGGAIDITKDFDDNKFLDCADAARADYLVTDNVQRFPRYWKNTKVITSREFLEMVAPHLLG